MSVNTVMLLGRLGKDPEVSTAKNGKKVAKFTLATDRYDKSTDWHSIVAFDKTAELCERFLRKGQRVYIMGSIQYTRYDKAGESKYFTSILADRVEFIERAGDVQSTTPANTRAKAPDFDSPLEMEREVEVVALDDEEIPF